MWRTLFGVGALSPAKFADLVAEIGVANGTFEEPRIDYDDMSISAKGRHLNLSNIYAAFLRIPRRERVKYIESVLVTPDLPEGWDQAKAKLLPVVRDGAYLTTAELMMHLRFARGDADAHPDKTKVARRLLVPGLFTTLVVDSPASMAIVAERQLEDLPARQGGVRHREHAGRRRDHAPWSSARSHAPSS